MRPWLLATTLVLACRREDAHVAADPAPEASITSSVAAKKAKLLCPAGMVLVDGDAKRLASFCLDRTETTVQEYSECVSAKACEAARVHTADDWECTTGAPSSGNHPVTCTSFVDAEKYCTWKGKRVPTSDQWHWAAHGGSRQTKYPWGNEEFGSDVCLSGTSVKRTGTCPVGVQRQDTTPEGVKDLFGNATEWVSGDSSKDAGGSACAAACCRAGVDGTDTRDTAGLRFERFGRVADGTCHERPASQYGIRCTSTPRVEGS